MNKQIILSALEDKLQNRKQLAQNYLEITHRPAAKELDSLACSWFRENVHTDIEAVSVHSDSVQIRVSDPNGESFKIDIYHRSGWNRKEGHFEMSPHRYEMTSERDCTNVVRYYSVVNSLVAKFDLICEEYSTNWNPKMESLLKELRERGEQVNEIEMEIRRVNAEIAEDRKSNYNEVGFECQIKPYTGWTTNADGTYVTKQTEHDLQLHYGRARYDYYRVNWFKVVECSKAKNGKVKLEFKSADLKEVRTREVSKSRYYDFVNLVDSWQNSGADERRTHVEEMVERWNANKKAA